jgi:hypothetical protein
MDKGKNIAYRILKIHSTSFSFKEIEEKELEFLFSNGNSSLNISSNIQFNEEKSSIVIDIKTSLTKKGEKDELISHTGRTSYLIQDLKKYYESDAESYNLPNNFILQILGIAFSHSRALLNTELQSTVYADKFILPVIDPSILLPQNSSHIKK